MKLHNRLSNKECIGKTITASLNENNAHIVRTFEGNPNNPEAYWLDVYDKDTNTIIYMDGETCTIVGYDEIKKEVFLSNDDCIIECIVIPYEQYILDFGLNWAS